jgi:hypothetical protein
VPSLGTLPFWISLRLALCATYEPTGTTQFSSYPLVMFSPALVTVLTGALALKTSGSLPVGIAVSLAVEPS